MLVQATQAIRPLALWPMPEKKAWECQGPTLLSPVHRLLHQGFDVQHSTNILLLDGTLPFLKYLLINYLSFS